MDFLLSQFLGCLLGIGLMLFASWACRNTERQYRKSVATGVMDRRRRTYWHGRYIETDDQRVLRFWAWLARYWQIADNICLAVAFLLIAAAAYWLILLMAAHLV
ncbi:MAG: hypothetical protein IPM16_06890 [Chloroflexi bacterium]|nr:hypothetical protein [Chloroflexota bacterium]